MTRVTRASTARQLQTKVQTTKAATKSSGQHRKGFSVYSIARNLAEADAEADADADAELDRPGIFGPQTPKSPRRSIAGARYGSTSAQYGSIGSISPTLMISHPRGRTFSDQHGHGYPLGDELTPALSVTGGKRKASDLSEEISPKRVRFATAVDSEAQAQPDDDFSIAQQDLALDAEFMFQPDLHLLDALSDVSEPISIHQISSLLRILQKLTGNFAATFFAHTAEDNNDTVGMDMQNFPLADLELKHHELYLTTVNLLDASTTDQVGNQFHVKNTEWLKFFAHPNYRPFLVTAILSEWFTQRIFKDTAFGLSDEGRKDMEENVDKRYIHFDGFVRAKRRSAVVEVHRDKDDADYWFSKAADDLADELMIVLAPMLPFFKRSGPCNEHLSPEDADHREEIRAALAQLVQRCAALNLAIVRTGEDGTIVRPANRLEKGKFYFPTAPMECINPRMVELARNDTESGKNERLVIKMTCWPRMEAWVPHGLDKWEMGVAEHYEKLKLYNSYKRAKTERGEEPTPEEITKLRRSFSWANTEKALWEVLPRELWSIDRKNRERQDMLRKSHEAHKKFLREQCRKNGSDGGSDSSDSSSSVLSYYSSSSPESDDETITDATGESEDGPRGSWVTEYTSLAPHTVYCEWAVPEGYSAKVAANEPVKSLQNAVRDARKNLTSPKSRLAKADDLLLKLWNFYASHSLAIEWGTFLVAVLVCLSRQNVPGNVVSMISAPLKITTRILDGACEVLSINTLSRNLIGLASKTDHGIATLGSNFHPEQLPVPVHVLDNATSYLSKNLGIFKTVVHNVLNPFKQGLSSAAAGSSVGRSEAFASMTHFIGQRKPFTTNPLSKLASLRSAISSVISDPSNTLRPVAAPSLAPVAAAVFATITPPPAIPQNLWTNRMETPESVDPYFVEAPVMFIPTAADKAAAELEPKIVYTTITELNPDIVYTTVTLPPENVLATPVRTTIPPTTATVTLNVDKTQSAKARSPSSSPGIWHSAASKAANVAGDFFFGTRRERRTISLKPGQTITKMMAHGDYQVV